MSNAIKDIEMIKDTYYYLLVEIINKKILIQNNFKIDENPYKNILIYQSGYVTMKGLKYIKINNVNPLYLIFREVNGYFEKINKSKYLTLVRTNKSKEKLKTHEEV